MIKKLWHRALGVSLASTMLLVAGCRGEQGGAEQNIATEERDASTVVAQSQGVDLEALARQFEDVGASDSLRLQAAQSLFKAGAESLADYYGKRDNDRLVRQLIEERIESRDETVLPLLVELFERVEGEERIDFEVYLLRFGRKSEGHLLSLLRAPDSGLVLRTLDALGKMQSVAAIDSIIGCLQRDDAWIRMGAAHALGDIGDRRGVAPLVQTLQDTAYSVVNAALVGLGRLQAVEAYDEIVALAKSDNVHVRKHAAIALGELGDVRAVEAVRRLAQEDEDSGVRFMAGRVLKKLEEQP